MAVFSRAVFQVAHLVTNKNSVKTVPFSTYLKLSHPANFNSFLALSANEESLAFTEMGNALGVLFLLFL